MTGNRNVAVDEAEAHAKALTDHECAGPKTVFTNVDGRQCIQAQCVFCFRRIGGAVKPCPDVFGKGITGHEDEYTSALPVRELVERRRRMAAFADLEAGVERPAYFKPVGDDDPLEAYRQAAWKKKGQERYRHESWQLLRKRVLERAGGCCEICGIPGGYHLDVHHLTYVRFWHERPEDLAALCRTCHFTKMHADKKQTT